MEECDDWFEDLSIRIKLVPAPGTDYDLYIYKGSCSNRVAFSTGRGSATEEINLSVNETWGSDDSTTYYIEVRWHSGDTCADWMLSTYSDCD
jgi:hypothetical protein